MKLFIGFDIGDAETIIAFAKGDDNNVMMATMPGKNAAGMAIPTLYGYSDRGKLQLADSVASNGTGLKQVAMNFKRRPADLIRAEDERKMELALMEEEELWEQPEIEKIRAYAEKLNTFIRIIFEDPDFVERLLPLMQGCNSCDVIVGHPTKWSDFDVKVYKMMLRHGILGEDTLCELPMNLVVAPESRAAFLYIRDAYQLELEDDEKVGLVDVGSSTIDISVIQGNDSRKDIYNDGQNFLGARSIDFLIMDYCIEKLSKDSPMAPVFNDVFGLNANGERKNPTAWDHLLINCRFAKERLFSAAEPDEDRLQTQIFILGQFFVTLTYNTLIHDICERPIAGVLKKYADLTEEDAAWLGNKNWKQAFEAFMTEQKDKMAEQDITLSAIFLTGSASRMFFVRDIIGKVFGSLTQNDLLKDTNTSNSIANGLSRVGVTDDMAAAFVADVEHFINGKDEDSLKAIIKSKIPDLINGIADPVLEAVYKNIFEKYYLQWQVGKIATLNDLKAKIENDIQDTKTIEEMIGKDAKCCAAIRHWTQYSLGTQIESRLQIFATQYNVGLFFNAGELNVFTVDHIEAAPSGVDIPVLDPTKIVNASLTAISALIGAVIGPIVAMVLFTLAMIISDTLYWTVAIGLLLDPDPVVSNVIALILIAAGLGGLVAGVKGGKLVNRKAAQAAAEKKDSKLKQAMAKADLPAFIRKKAKIEKMRSVYVARIPEMKTKFSEEMCGDDKAETIAEKIKISIKGQVQERADEIKYAIIHKKKKTQTADSTANTDE